MNFQALTMFLVMLVSPERTVFCACVPFPDWVGRTHLDEVLTHPGKKDFPLLLFWNFTPASITVLDWPLCSTGQKTP